MKRLTDCGVLLALIFCAVRPPCRSAARESGSMTFYLHRTWSPAAKMQIEQPAVGTPRAVSGYA